MTRTYDGDKHVALEAERKRLQDEIQVVATKMNDSYHKDGWDGDDGPGRMAQYTADNIRHHQLSRELTEVDRQIDRMEAVRPVSKAELKSNPIMDICNRWFVNGPMGLDEGEREIFCPPVEGDLLEDQRRRGVTHFENAQCFDPWALATQNSQRPFPARMAAGDPSRSDSAASGDAASGVNLNPAAPETWAAGVVESLQYYGSVAANCHNFTTSNGNVFHQNQLDTKDEEGVLLTSQANDATGNIPSQASTIGNAGDVEFGAAWMVSRNIDARIETFDDIHFDVAGRVMREMTRRIGRGWNRVFTIGHGDVDRNNIPQGIVASAKIIDGGNGSADDGTGGIDYENLINMEYGIDLAYLEGGEGGDGGFMDAHGGMVGWMMNRNVEKQLRFATFPGTAGLPIWVPDPTNMGIAMQRAPGRILGYPYSINQHMGTGTAATVAGNLYDDYLAATDKAAFMGTVPPLLFGACGHYAVRNVGGPVYYRFFDSGTSNKMSVRFTGYSRRDGRSRGPHTGSGAAAKNDAYCVLHVKA